MEREDGRGKCHSREALLGAGDALVEGVLRDLVQRCRGRAPIVAGQRLVDALLGIILWFHPSDPEGGSRECQLPEEQERAPGAKLARQSPMA